MKAQAVDPRDEPYSLERTLNWTVFPPRQQPQELSSSVGMYPDSSSSPIQYFPFHYWTSPPILFLSRRSIFPVLHFTVVLQPGVNLLNQKRRTKTFSHATYILMSRTQARPRYARRHIRLHETVREEILCAERMRRHARRMMRNSFEL